MKNNNSQVKSGSRIGPLIGVLLIIGSIAGFVFYTQPLSENLTEAREQISSNSIEINNLQQRVQFFEDAEDNLDLSTQVQRNLILNSIPLSLNQDEVIEDVIDISDENDIELTSISFGKGSSGKEGVGALRVNASFEGSFSDLTRFLEGIETNGRLLKVSSINVQVTKLNVSQFERANFSLSMDAFYQEQI